MAFTKKLTVYDTTLEQVLVFIVGRHSPAAAQAARFKEVILKYEVQLSDQAYQVLQANPLLKQKIQLDMIQIGKSIVEQKIMRQMGRNQQVTPLFVRRVEAALNEGRPQVNALVDSVLKRHAEMDKAWGDYYRSQRKDLIMNVVGIALTSASIALAVPTGGASLALTIAGGARTIAGTVNKLQECWRTAEQQRDRLMKSIEVLLRAYLKSVHAGRAVQLTGAVLDTVGVLPVLEMLPFVRQQLMPSMKKIDGDMSVYKGKLGHLYSVANKLAAQLFELLDQIDEFKKTNPGVEMRGLAKIEKRIDQLLDSGVRKAGFRNKLTISGAYSRYELGMIEYETFTVQVQRLNGLETNPRAVVIIGEVIKVLGNLAFAAGGYGTGVDTGTAKEILSLSATVAGDVIGTVSDFVDLAETAKKDSPDPQSQSVIQQVEAQFENIPVPTPPPRPPRPQGQRIARPRSGPPVPPRRRPLGPPPSTPPPIPQKP